MLDTVYNKKIYIPPINPPFNIPFLLIFLVDIVLPINILITDITIITIGIVDSGTLLYVSITEKILKQLILEDMENFLNELGEGFSFIKSEYKIKIGNRYNYIDLLLYNIKYNCYIVVELKVTELKKEHIGQIQTYMNYIDKNIRSINQDKTIGIIICRKGNEFVLEYSSDDRIFETNFILN